MDKHAAGLIADFLLDGEWTPEALAARWEQLPGGLGRRAKWPARLMVRIFETEEFSTTSPTHARLTQFLLRDEKIQQLVHRSLAKINDWAASVSVLDRPALRMIPSAAAAEWQLPSIVTPGQLADVLHIPVRHIDWLADPGGFEHTCEKEKLRNYRYHWIEKSAGGQRLLEAPKATLKKCQRWIADNILRRVPVHEAAHAFCSGRSPVTAARQHVGQAVVLRIDLCDFFPSVSGARVAGIFRSVGYPSRVTRLLVGLCTNTTWQGIFDGFSPDGKHFGIDRRDIRMQRFVSPHLPQGSPSSPALANLAAWKLDRRLTGLARKFAAHYTRYADDLVFSGDAQFGNELREFRLMVCAICLSEGFEIRARKTTVMRSHKQQKVTGVVVNQRLSVDRREYKLLKAILHNCQRFGPASQNRNNCKDFQAHLTGRVAWVSHVHPEKGARLKAALDSIVWATDE